MFFSETRLNNICREGKVSTVYPERMSCRVTFPDRNNLVSAEMPILVPVAGSRSQYGLPRVGDRVICLMAGNDLTGGGGYVIGSLYTGSGKPRSNSQFLTRQEYADGSSHEYDEKESMFTTRFADGAEIFYKGGNGSSDSYSAENKNHDFHFKFQDGTELSYHNDDAEHKFEMKFNDGAAISYSNGNGAAEFEMKFADGSRIEHDGAAGNLEMTINGNIEMTSARRIIIDASDEIDIKARGAVNVRGNTVNLN